MFNKCRKLNGQEDCTFTVKKVSQKIELHNKICPTIIFLTFKLSKYVFWGIKKKTFAKNIQ